MFISKSYIKTSAAVVMRMCSMSHAIDDSEKYLSKNTASVPLCLFRLNFVLAQCAESL